MKRPWLILIPLALLVWGVLADRVALVLLAIVAYFWIRRLQRSGPIGRLASVPADAAAETDQKMFRPDVMTTADGAAAGGCGGCGGGESSAGDSGDWWRTPTVGAPSTGVSSNGSSPAIDWNVSTPAARTAAPSSSSSSGGYLPTGAAGTASKSSWGYS